MRFIAPLLVCAHLMLGVSAYADTLDQQNVFVSAIGDTASGLSLELGQTFTVGLSGQLSRVEVYLSRFTFTTDDVVLSIYDTIGGLPDNHLGSVQLPASIVSPTTPEFVSFDVSAFDIMADVGDHLAFSIASTGGGIYILPFSESVLYDGGAPVSRVLNTPPSPWSFYGSTIRDYGFRTFMLTASMPNGDFNGDLSWNCADVNDLVVQIVSGGNNPLFDLTGDGLVNPSDLAAWLVMGGANNPVQTGGNPFRRGDANLDGFVDGSDFNIWNSNKFRVTPAWCSGDFNGDGVIDGSDFNLWNGNKFTSSQTQLLVPEPVGCLGIAFGLLAACRMRRRELRATA